MPPAPPIVKQPTETGLRRVDEALARHGMLLVQGQGEVPSVADLLEGRAITTRGFSYDYVPAWILSRTLGDRPDIATLRLVGGRKTLVDRRFWPAIDALARHNVRTVCAGDTPHAALLRLIADNPGIMGASAKLALGLDGAAGSRRFQALKNDLLAWCCIFPTEQDEPAAHSHDAAWHAWTASKIAAGAGQPVSEREAVAILTGAILGAPAAADPRVKKIIPVLSWS